MRIGSNRRRANEGAAIVVAMVLILLGTMAVGVVAMSTGTRLRQAERQASMEQAFYIAEAGAERAASRVAAGQSTSTTLRGTLGDGSYETQISMTPASGGSFQIDVVSTGTVNGVQRGVSMRGLRRVSWARYALWYDSEVTKLWIVGGESFNGPVYSRPQFHFHSSGVSTKGQARFYDVAWSAASTIEKQNSSVNPQFDEGVRLNASIETMSSVDFNELKSNADLVLDGTTTITISGDSMKVTNSRKGWSSKSMPLPEDGLIYVRTATSGTSSSKPANVSVSAPDGVDGRVTIVAENDILVTGHIRCEDNPATNPASDDAVGLIAKRHVAVQTSAPNNVDIYAHIICQEGGFGVVDYDEGRSRGSLNVYGGIVNKVRNAVGTTGGTGYAKNYVFDPRFSKKPPPHYPTLADELEWTQWEG